MTLSSEQYGYALAERVLEYLLQYGSIRHEHYGYCGVGFVLVDHTILYTHFDEWLTYASGRQYVPGGDYIGICPVGFWCTANRFGWLFSLRLIFVGTTRNALTLY